jgi:multidrug transporter EmrE-like cation transporter
MMLPSLALAASLLCTAAGMVMFKHYYRSHKRADFFYSIALFAAVPLTTFFALRGLSLGFVYMSTAATHILVLGLSQLVLGERVPARVLPGIVLILAGIIAYGI